MRKGAITIPQMDRIVYGEPAAAAIAAEAERLGARRVFMIVSGTMNRTTEEVRKVEATLGGRYVGLHDRIPAHTPRDAVLEAAAAARDAAADLIVTFGGGSVTDAGKMVQLCLRHDIRTAEDFEPFRIRVAADGTRIAPEYEGPTVRQIAVPTTLSAGEFHSQVGCTDHRIQVKQSYRHPLLAPRVVIFDPVPTVLTPLHVWLSTGIRALDHAAEGLCSPFANPVGDASYLQALALLREALPKVKRDPADLDARLDCQLAIWLSMAGRHSGVHMGASHAIGHILGGTCGVLHGYTSCVILPHVLRYNRSVNAERQALLAAALGQPGEPAADVVAALVAELGLPGSLSEVGVRVEQFPLIARNTMHDGWLHTNPRKITSPDQVMEILNSAA